MGGKFDELASYYLAKQICAGLKPLADLSLMKSWAVYNHWTGLRLREKDMLSIDLTCLN